MRLYVVLNREGGLVDMFKSPKIITGVSLGVIENSTLRLIEFTEQDIKVVLNAVELFWEDHKTTVAYQCVKAEWIYDKLLHSDYKELINKIDTVCYRDNDIWYIVLNAMDTAFKVREEVM